MKKNKDLLVFGMLGIAGYLLYKFIKDKITPATSTTETETQQTQQTQIVVTPKIPKQTGFVYTETITPAIKSISKTGLINAFGVNVEGLNVRKGPSKTTEALTSLPKGILIGASQYILTKKVPDGWKVIIFPKTYNGISIQGCFVSSQYLTDTNKLYGE
jgi:hypothetical protein